MSSAVKPPTVSARAHVQLELLPAAEREHGADHQDAPGAVVEMRPGPDVAPGAAGDVVDPFGVEGVAALRRAVDPFVAEHAAARGLAALEAFGVVHADSLPP